MFTVVVSGSRDWVFGRRIFDTLDVLLRVHKRIHVVEGGAPGADTFAGLWAEKNRQPHTRVPAQWKKFGRAAGPKRNREMLDLAKPDLVVAFPIEGGKGTQNMIELAKSEGYNVKVFWGER